MSNKEKKLARDRATGTGESYAAALAAVRHDHAFHAKVEGIIALSRAWEREWDAAMADVRRGRDRSPLAVITEEDTRAVRSLVSAAERLLDGAFGRVTDEELRWVEALVWFGREVPSIDPSSPVFAAYREDDPRVLLDRHLRNAQGLTTLPYDRGWRDSTIEYLKGKPLARQLTDALRFAAKCGIDPAKHFKALSTR